MSPLDGWVDHLRPHHRDRQKIELTVARDLAKNWRLGWYVAPYGKRWTIGKMTIADPYLRFVVVDDDGEALDFMSVEKALEFFRKELGLFGVAMFHT